MALLNLNGGFMVKVQVWAKWKYCEPQVEALFETKAEASEYMEKLLADNPEGSNLMDAWLQTTKFTEYLEREFEEDF